MAAHSSGSTSASRAQAIPSRRAIVIGGSLLRRFGRLLAVGRHRAVVLSRVGARDARIVAHQRWRRLRWYRAAQGSEGPLAESWPHPAGSDERGGCSEPGEEEDDRGPAA